MQKAGKMFYKLYDTLCGFSYRDESAIKTFNKTLVKFFVWESEKVQTTTVGEREWEKAQRIFSLSSHIKPWIRKKLLIPLLSVVGKGTFRVISYRDWTVENLLLREILLLESFWG